MVELVLPRALKTLCVKIDSGIDARLAGLAERLGFASKSALVRFMVCRVLADLGLLRAEEEHLCYPGLDIAAGGEEDPELIAALATLVAQLRGLSVEDAFEAVHSGIRLLRDIAEA